MYDNSLYAGTSNGNTGCEIWQRTGPDPGNWAQVNANGFGDKRSELADSMTVFGSPSGRLYAGVTNYEQGCQVWRYNNPGWTKVSTNGFGNISNFELARMASYNSKLYAGVSGYSIKVYKTGGTGGPLYSWDLINTPGFTSNSNYTAERSVVFQGNLYIGTGSDIGCEVWRYDGTSWTRIAANGFGDSGNSSPGQILVVGSKLYASTWNHDEGEVWAYNGRSWSQVNTNGFGDPNNGAIVFLCSDGTRIYAGTLNEKQGCEVWSAALPAATWYLAEGTTAWGFDCYISIENPNSSDVTARITFMKSDGANVVQTIGLPKTSQVTVNPRDFVGDCDFSTRVECVQGKAIAVDRTMSWTGSGASSPEGHSSVGVTARANTWYLAEGSSAWGFECWLLIQNPNSSAATCQVNYMIEGTGLKSVVKKVPANSRKTFFMADDIGPGDASIQVFSDVPVIPERAMYRNNRREGHDSIGTTRPALTYFLAAGTTAWGFTTYVLVQNPNPIACDVTVTYMTPSGPKPQAPFPMTPNSRKTIRVNDIPEVSNTDLSTSVTGTKPIISERAMYWDNGTGEACHDSIGMDKAHMSFYLPDGQTSDGCETWTLVQNPNNKGVLVHITYMTPDGHGNVEFDETIPANSRRTFNMVDKGISGRAAVMVTSKTSGNPIMCERAMYWNSRGAGTDTIGGYSN